MLKGNVLLFIASVLGLVYAIYLISYFAGTKATEPVEQIGKALAGALVLPHLVITILAVIFGFIGFFMYARWSALVSGILYSVALVLFLPYFMFIIVERILAYVAYAKMKSVAPQVTTTV